MIGDPTISRTWRPQAFGRRNARHVGDPLVEPLWAGIRVLAHATPDGVEFVDANGDTKSWPEVEAALASSLATRQAVLDGYLTTEAASDGIGVVAGTGVAMPNAAEMSRQMLIGGARSRRGELHEALESAAIPKFGVGDVVVFVAVDLLQLDDEPLLDVPLLERKRLLEAVLGESELVRRTSFVRPTAGGSLIAWRALGFAMLAYKAANSRYRPGEVNDAWATAPAPSASSPRPSGGSSTS
jgi:ATP-dependent DNA ligase